MNNQTPADVHVAHNRSWMFLFCFYLNNLSHILTTYKDVKHNHMINSLAMLRIRSQKLTMSFLILSFHCNDNLQMCPSCSVI